MGEASDADRRDLGPPGRRLVLVRPGAGVAADGTVEPARRLRRVNANGRVATGPCASWATVSRRDRCARSALRVRVDAVGDALPSRYPAPGRAGTAVAVARPGDRRRAAALHSCRDRRGPRTFVCGSSSRVGGGDRPDRLRAGVACPHALGLAIPAGVRHLDRGSARNGILGGTPRPGADAPAGHRLFDKTGRCPRRPRVTGIWSPTATSRRCSNRGLRRAIGASARACDRRARSRDGHPVSGVDVRGPTRARRPWGR